MRRADAQTRRRAAWRVRLCLSVRLCVCASFVACGRAQWREADTRLNARRGAGPFGRLRTTRGPPQHLRRLRLGGHGHLAHAPRGAAVLLHRRGCSSGCDTLDFSLAEPQGRQLAADTTAGPTPRLTFTTPEEGDYHVTFHFGH